MKTNRILLLATTATLLISGASGFGQVNQALRGAVSATTVLPQPPPGIGAAANAAGAAQMATGAAGINGAASGAISAAAAVPNPNPPQINAGLGVGVTAGAPGMEVGVEGKADAWAALDFDGTMRRLNAVRLEARSELFDDLDARVRASDKALVVLGEHSEMFSAESREEFRAAVKDAHAKEKALRRSEKEAKRADADDWAKARGDLSTHYAAYAQAVRHAQVTAAAASSAKAGGAMHDRDATRHAGSIDADARAQAEAAATAKR